MTPIRTLALLSGVALVGCGGARKSAPPSKTPTAPQAPPGAGSPAPGYGAEPGSRAAPAPTDESVKAQQDLDQPMPTLDDALSAFQQAQTRLSASKRDCGTACRALESMRRAADRICELAPGGPEHRCERAQHRLRDAERRVRAGCGAC